MSEKKKETELEEMRKVEYSLRDLRKDVDKRLNDLSERVGPVRDRAAKKIAERPFLTLPVAFTIGVAVGVAISKLND